MDYYECYDVQSQGDMHGNAVVTLLAGKTCGVAPGVRVYYVAAPTGLSDSAYWADGLIWIIDKNETLPENEKIRLVSVSGNLSGTDYDEEIKKILIDSAYENQYGERNIYPSAFIEMVENTL